MCRSPAGRSGASTIRRASPTGETDGAFEDILPEDDWFEQTAFDGGSVRPRHAGQPADEPALQPRAGTHRSATSPTARATPAARTTPKDLSWHTDVSHTVGPRFTGTGTFNYFRQPVSPDTFADPPFATYAMLDGTPNALFPNGTRLVRLIDRGRVQRAVGGGRDRRRPDSSWPRRRRFDFPSTSAYASSAGRRSATRATSLGPGSG